MELSQPIIQQFVNGELSGKDAQIVIKLLEANPKWLDGFLDETEWDNLGQQQVLDKAALDSALADIKLKAYGLPRHRPVRRILRITSIAASIAAAMLLFIWGAQWVRTKQDSSSSLVVNPATNDTFTYSNNADTILPIALAEGSSIRLEPRSRVVFARNFPSNKRVVSLEGAAFFSVAKDKARPFEVQAAGFSTIALGTSFKVQAPLESSNIAIELYTGKVLIKQTVENGTFQNVVLLPNQQLVIDTKGLGSQLNTIGNNKPTLKKTDDTPMLNWDNYLSGENIQFENTLLSDIFQVLEHQYRCVVKYDKKIIEGMVFTGTFKKSDTVQYILSTITSINGLSLSKGSDNIYIIYK